MQHKDSSVTPMAFWLGLALPYGAGLLFWGFAAFSKQLGILDDWPTLIFLLWGLIQWIYLVPLALYQSKVRNNQSFSLGLWLGGGILLLLWGACWGVVLSSLGRMH